MVLPSAVSTLLCVRTGGGGEDRRLSAVPGQGSVWASRAPSRSLHPLSPQASTSTNLHPDSIYSTLTSTSNFTPSEQLQCTQDVSGIVLFRSLCAATNSYILDWISLGRLVTRFPLLSLYCPNLLMMGGSVATFSSLSSNNAGGISM